MLTKRPTSFVLTTQYRVDALWLNGTGPEVKAEAPPPSAAPGAPPATSADLHGLEGLLRKPDPKMTLSLPEDAELIDQLHKLTGENAEICAIQSTTSRIHTGAVSIPQAHGGRGRAVAKRDQRRATRSPADPGILRSDLRTAQQTHLGR